ncbi:hypothetical protein BDV95DRAFT_611889 [Massariosphaeria phaeospora]|uniref:Uncharacterized protein n=1 Tax=Massariosphaeria phaeospora TaxID=100035 RepID=A0A7C8M261_9PLEO|nr:hypothetical protein BDV95DRAFT_611889 [Massariosphaeria phaeospora]
MIAREYLAARQASTSSTPRQTGSPTSSGPPPGITQSTKAIPLTTTFTAPPTCTVGMVTILPPPGYFIWANEPVPVANQMLSNCYPSEFMQSYTAVTSGSKVSSIVPAMSPLVCPDNYCTMFAGDNNYLACCPSGYQLHAPDSTVDTNRPAYGGTCYSDFSESSTYTVVAYDEKGSTRTQPLIPTASMQAYAHPIDGFAESAPAVGCRSQPSSLRIDTSSAPTAVAIPISSLATPISSPTNTPTALAHPSLSTGGIAGIIVASVVGLALLIGGVWATMRWRAMQTAPPPPPKTYTTRRPPVMMFEKEAGGDLKDMSTSSSPNSEKGLWRLSETNQSRGLHEMNGIPVYEMEGSGEKRVDLDEAQARDWKARQ